jgi:hypothetical protein
VITAMLAPRGQGRLLRFSSDATAPAEIGCILLVNPVFFPPSDLVAQPSDWPVRTQSHGSTVHAPASAQHRPAAEFLRWHNERVSLS